MTFSLPMADQILTYASAPEKRLSLITVGRFLHMASAEERGSIEHVFTRAEHEGNARFKPLCRVSRLPPSNRGHKSPTTPRQGDHNKTQNIKLSNHGLIVSVGEPSLGKLVVRQRSSQIKTNRHFEFFRNCRSWT